LPLIVALPPPLAETNNAINAEPGNERRILGPPLTTANAGKIVVVDNSQLDLGGLVANTGTIAVNASSHATALQVNGTTLTGKGKLTLTNNTNNAITSDLPPGAVADATLSGSIGGTVRHLERVGVDGERRGADGVEFLDRIVLRAADRIGPHRINDGGVRCAGDSCGCPVGRRVEATADRLLPMESCHGLTSVAVLLPARPVDCRCRTRDRAV
jgi:hypothetical protein